jgi:hypothetical protein
LVYTGPSIDLHTVSNDTTHCLSTCKHDCTVLLGSQTVGRIDRSRCRHVSDVSDRGSLCQLQWRSCLWRAKGMLPWACHDKRTGERGATANKVSTVLSQVDNLLSRSCSSCCRKSAQRSTRASYPFAFCKRKHPRRWAASSSSTRKLRSALPPVGTSAEQDPSAWK